MMNISPIVNSVKCTVLTRFGNVCPKNLQIDCQKKLHDQQAFILIQYMNIDRKRWV